MDNTYFANQEATKAAGILLDKSDSFYNVLRSNAYLEKIQKMWSAYHGIFGESSGDGHQIQFDGQQGELVQFPVNEFRNLAQHMLNMICATRPVMEARAINTDYKSMAQTYLANGILDYYMREKRLEDCLKKATEMAIVMGSGYIKMDWNATAGEAYDHDEDTNQTTYEGEIEFTNLSPLDVVVDGTKESWNNEWMLVRSFQNRFNLIAKYPELTDQILAMPSKTDSTIYRLGLFSNDSTDDIPIYEFFHKRTEAVPDGRYLLFIDSNIVLLDAKLPYRVIPVFRIVPGEILGTPYGYSPMFDVFPIQEMINATYSAIATNQNAFAVQNVWVPHGADLNISTLEGALNVVTGSAKPEPLNLLQTSKESFEFLNLLIAAGERISGLNSVARGNAPEGIKSGNALALLQSTALQFISGLQQSYVKLVEDTGTALIQILKDFALTPKTVALVGKNNRPLLKEFTGEEISSINRVIVDIGNPLSRTTAGRVSMAEQLLQMKLLKNPEQYFQVLNTGRLDAMFQGEMSELLLIQSENESLMDGRPIKALAIDRHRIHIEEHRSVIAGADLREDPDLADRTLAHIQEHIQMLRTVDPDLLQLIGEQPLQPPQQNANPQQQGNLPPGPMNPQGGQPGPKTPQGNPHQGPPQGQQPQQPPVKALQRSPMNNIIGEPEGAVGPGQKVMSEAGGITIPAPAVPPKPFNHMPTNASQQVPK